MYSFVGIKQPKWSASALPGAHLMDPLFVDIGKIDGSYQHVIIVSMM